MSFKDKIFEPSFVPKGWGGEIIPVNKKEYCGKVLIFNKGKKCSFHRHFKDENFFLFKGRLILRISEEDDLNTAEEFILEEGQCYYIYPNLVHQMEGLADVSYLIEYSTQDTDESIRIVKGD